MANGQSTTKESQMQRIERYRRLFTVTTVNDYGTLVANSTAAIAAFSAEHGITEDGLRLLKDAVTNRRHSTWLLLLQHFRSDDVRIGAILDLFAALAASVLDGLVTFGETDVVLTAISAADLGHPLDEAQHACCIDRIIDGPRSKRVDDIDRMFARYLDSPGMNDRQRAFFVDWWLHDHLTAGTVNPKTLTLFASTCKTLTASQHAQFVDTLLTKAPQAFAEFLSFGEQVTSLEPEHHAAILLHLLLRSGADPKMGIIGNRKVPVIVSSYARRAHLTEAVTQEVLQHLTDSLRKELTEALKLDLGFDSDKIVA